MLHCSTARGNGTVQPNAAQAPSRAGRVRGRAAATRPGGRIVLSGILSDQGEEVAAAYRPWFHMDQAVHDEGWVCLAGVRRASKG